MSGHEMTGAAELSAQFTQAERGPEPEWTVDHDAAEWEPVEDTPRELHLTLDYTPGGALEYDVHSELERAKSHERQAERESQALELSDEQELDFSGDFNSARQDQLRNSFCRQAERAPSWEEVIEQQFGPEPRQELNWER